VRFFALLLQVGLVSVGKRCGDGAGGRKNAFDEARRERPGVDNEIGIDKPAHDVRGGLVAGTGKGLKSNRQSSLIYDFVVLRFELCTKVGDGMKG
jgi:hypothetical protein